MNRIKFGLFAPQVGAPFSVLKERAQLVDRLGFHSIWFVDHMWSRGLPDLDHLEAWTLMSAIAAVTERLGIGTLVLCNSYRNPALLAKMASSLDQISNGRFLLGLGAGWMDEEYRAYGYPFPAVRVRIEQLEEALAIIKLLFKESRATFQGKYYAVNDAVNNPKPLQQPHPPILIGGAGEKRLLRKSFSVRPSTTMVCSETSMVAGSRPKAAQCCLSTSSLCSSSSAALFGQFQMSACSATSRSSRFSPAPPMRIGGCGCCSGFGLFTASLTA